MQLLNSLLSIKGENSIAIYVSFEGLSDANILKYELHFLSFLVIYLVYLIKSHFLAGLDGSTLKNKCRKGDKKFGFD